MEITTASASIAGKKALQLITSDLFAVAKGSIKSLIKQYSATRRIEHLYSEIAAFRNVKTIWKIDQPVDLLDFYFPTTVKLGLAEEETIIENISDFSGNLVIEGTAGQGKSIFLRYLCSRKLIQGGQIPIFLELRRLKQSELLVTALLNRFKVLGFAENLELFEFFAKNNKLILLLDGFDEVDSARQRTLVSEIEELAELFPTTQIVVATRPETQIVYSRHFTLGAIAYLKQDQVADVIYRITQGTEIAGLLVKALADTGGEVTNALRTPLMITLLIFTYQARRIVPRRFSEFYDQLFTILLNRHDVTKLGLVRERACELSDDRMEAVFNSLCFLLRKHGISDPSKGELHGITRRALQANAESCAANRYVEDIVRVTNLILREGDQYFFIHNSVQEFHAAKYVCTLEDEKRSELFYEAIRKGHWRRWNAELEFLREIDKYRFTRFFLIPELQSFFREYARRTPQTWNQTPKSVRARILRRYTIGWSLDDPHMHYFEIGIDEDSWAQQSLLEEKHNLLNRLLECSNWLRIKENIQRDTKAKKFDAHGNEVYVMRTDHAIEHGYINEPSIVKLMDRICEEAFSDLQEANTYIESRESNIAILDFD